MVAGVALLSTSPRRRILWSKPTRWKQQKRFTTSGHRAPLRPPCRVIQSSRRASASLLRKAAPMQLRWLYVPPLEHDAGIRKEMGIVPVACLRLWHACNHGMPARVAKRNPLKRRSTRPKRPLLTTLLASRHILSHAVCHHANQMHNQPTNHRASACKRQ